MLMLTIPHHQCRVVSLLNWMQLTQKQKTDIAHQKQIKSKFMFWNYLVKEPKYLADTYLPTDPQAGAKEKLRKQNFVQSNPICLCHKVYVSQYSWEEDKNFKPK